MGLGSGLRGFRAGLCSGGLVFLGLTGFTYMVYKGKSRGIWRLWASSADASGMTAPTPTTLRQMRRPSVQRSAGCEIS